MMEIKFRGKRTDNGKWVYGHYFIAPLTDEATDSKPADGWFFLTGRARHCISQNHCVYEVIPETVGQYTGTQDDNKNDLYIGDVFKTGYKSPLDGRDKIIRYKITFHNYCFTAEILTKPYEASFPLFLTLSKNYSVKLIGNIHDNPELLEAANGKNN